MKHSAQYELYITKVKKIIPEMHSNLHKGSLGRIAVIGGSAQYTGAPYYCASAALRCGADLSYVYCFPDAATPIKCYSPELIVQAALNESSSCDWSNHLKHVHTVILGPGLGRSSGAEKTAIDAILHCNEKSIPVVCDADALFLLGNSFSRWSSKRKQSSPVLLTPNIRELEYLRNPIPKENSEQSYEEKIRNKEIVVMDHRSEPLDIEEILVSLIRVCDFWDCGVFLKSESDVVTLKTGPNKFFQYVLKKPKNCPKRCGGQGDILGGLISVFLHWGKLEGKGVLSDEAILASCMGAVYVLNEAAWMGYQKHKRGMVASDVLNNVDQAFQNLFDN